MDGGCFPFAIYRFAIFTLDARARSTSARRRGARDESDAVCRQRRNSKQTETLT